MLTTLYKELSHEWTSTLIEHTYISQNTVQNKMKTVHFNMKILSENSEDEETIRCWLCF